MMTPVCPRLLNLNNDFVLLRFWARAPEDLSAIEVIYIIIIIIKGDGQFGYDGFALTETLHNPIVEK